MDNGGLWGSLKTASLSFGDSYCPCVDSAEVIDVIISLADMIDFSFWRHQNNLGENGWENMILANVSTKGLPKHTLLHLHHHR